MGREMGRVLAVAAALTAGAQASGQEFRTNVRGLDRRNLDTSVSACDDFYQYANGGWLERNPIPADQPRWGISHEMRERNYVLLQEILEEAAGTEAEAGTNRRRVGDFWATAMDTTRVEEAGAKPLGADLARIAAIQDGDGLQAFLRDIHAEGTTILFDLTIFQDLQESTRYIAYATQGGLGLPERDYYTRDDDESKALRETYTAHVSQMLQLIDDEKEAADAAAVAILVLEQRLVQASLGAVELRNPANFYNIKTVEEADDASPRFSWSAYFTHLGLELESFSYAQPRFFAEMNAALAEVPLATWKSYLRWHLLNAFVRYLSQELVERDFEFFGRTLQGTQELQPRWKRVVDQTSASMGEALGQVYVERAFPPESKARADEMIENLRAAVRGRLQELEWIGDETKARALEKLATFTAKIGYPDEWRDYSKLEVGTDSYLANVRRARRFEMQRNLAKIGKQIDRNEWNMSPQTVNAYYSPVQNEIVFPAAIMQPPFFDRSADDAVNYGAMGGVIGHELMHGFDDQGSRFDAQGNMKNWWTDEDRARFEERTAKLVEQYGGYVAVDDIHVNGELTLGENIGDLAGTTVAYDALQMALKKHHPGEIDGFSPEQRFFLSYAQAWRNNYRPEALKLLVNTDPHAPPKFRTNGPLGNMTEFAQAFGCQQGDAMVRPADARAEIW